MSIAITIIMTFQKEVAAVMYKRQIMNQEIIKK